MISIDEIYFNSCGWVSSADFIRFMSDESLPPIYRYLHIGTFIPAPAHFNSIARSTLVGSRSFVINNNGVRLAVNCIAIIFAVPHIAHTHGHLLNLWAHTHTHPNTKRSTIRKLKLRRLFTLRLITAYTTRSFYLYTSRIQDRENHSASIMCSWEYLCFILLLFIVS